MPASPLAPNAQRTAVQSPNAPAVPAAPPLSTQRAAPLTVPTIAVAPIAPPLSATEMPEMIERTAIVEAMLEATYDLPRAARALGMDPEKLEERILVTGLADLVCPVCYCERPPDAEECACGQSRGWMAFDVSPLKMERKRIVDAMTAGCDLPGGARLLEMHPRELEKRIVAVGLTEPVCVACFRENHYGVAQCECGGENWIAYNISTQASATHHVPLGAPGKFSSV